MPVPRTAGPSSLGQEFLIERAKEDLAQRLNISITQIKLSETKAVTWPDSSLGCPQLGMFYTQVLTDGYLIRLQANDQTYEYHANRDRYVFLCENPSSAVPGIPGDR